MAHRIGVDGLKELNESLKRFPIKLQKRALRRAVSAGASVVVKAQKATAPVLQEFDRRRTAGALKRGVTKQRRTRGVKIAALFAVGVASGKSDDATNDPFYKRFVESGYAAVGSRRVKGLGRAGRKRTAKRARQIPGHHFIERSIKTSGRQAVEVMRAKLRANIQKLDLK